MKNIHVLPTDKPSRLHLAYDKYYYLSVEPFIQLDTKNYESFNIYITSDEEIKEGDYWLYICPINGLDYGDNNKPIVKNNLPNSWFEKLHDRLNYKKIILTTDQDLIKDGVQAINDEFLEWFVKNPSCEKVKIDSYKTIYHTWLYKIIIPKGTLEKTAVEWLETQIIKFHIWKRNPIYDENCFDEIELKKAIEQAKEMEKQHIIDACKEFGNLNGVDLEDYEQYYNETYKK